jgi:hypothetical protein
MVSATGAGIGLPDTAWVESTTRERNVDGTARLGVTARPDLS